MMVVQSLVFILLAVWDISSVTAIKMYVQERCGQTIPMQEIGINWLWFKPSTHAKYSPNMDCYVTIETERQKKLVIVFKTIHMEYEPLCDDDFLTLYDGNSTDSQTIDGLPHKICGELEPPGSYTTTKNTMMLRFKTDSYENAKGFNIIITSYHTGNCNEAEYTCDNGRCIYKSLVSDGRNNCGDDSDEIHIGAKAIWGVVFGVFIFTIIGVCFVITKRRRKRKKRETFLQNQKEINHKVEEWRPEEISPPEGHRCYDVKPGESKPYTIELPNYEKRESHIPGLMENSTNITFELHYDDEDDNKCSHHCHYNEGYDDDDDDDDSISKRAKKDRSISLLW